MFKVGDKVRAIDDRYSVTNKRNGFIGEIIELIDEISSVEPKDLRVKELNGSAIYKVNSKHFEIVEEPTEFTFQELISRNIPGVYVNCSNPHAKLKEVEIQQGGRIVLRGKLADTTGIGSSFKFKLQEPQRQIVIYKVEHKEDGKQYDFISSQLLNDNMFVICDTSNGKSYGRVVGIEEKYGTNEEYKQYKECWRA